MAYAYSHNYNRIVLLFQFIFNLITACNNDLHMEWIIRYNMSIYTQADICLDSRNFFFNSKTIMLLIFCTIFLSPRSFN